MSTFTTYNVAKQRESGDSNGWFYDAPLQPLASNHGRRCADFLNEGGNDQVEEEEYDDEDDDQACWFSYHTFGPDQAIPDFSSFPMVEANQQGFGDLAPSSVQELPCLMRTLEISSTVGSFEDNTFAPKAFTQGLGDALDRKAALCALEVLLTAKPTPFDGKRNFKCVKET